MQTSLIINTTDSNDKALAKTLTFVNAACPAAVLKTAAQKLNALTTNTYVKTTRIDKTFVDTEAKTARNVKVSYTDYSGGGSGTNVTINDAQATVPTSALQNVSGSRRLVVNVSNQPALTDDTSRLMLSDLSTTVGTVSVPSITNFLAGNNCQMPLTLSEAVAQVITFKLSLAENAKYAGWSQSFTVTVTEGGEG